VFSSARAQDDDIGGSNSCASERPDDLAQPGNHVRLVRGIEDFHRITLDLLFADPGSSEAHIRSVWVAMRLVFAAVRAEIEDRRPENAARTS